MERQVKAAFGAGLLKKPIQVNLGGSFRDTEFAGDFLVLEATRQHAHQLALPLGERHAPGGAKTIHQALFEPKVAGINSVQTLPVRLQGQRLAKDAADTDGQRLQREIAGNRVVHRISFDSGARFCSSLSAADVISGVKSSTAKSGFSFAKCFFSTATFEQLALDSSAGSAAIKLSSPLARTG